MKIIGCDYHPGFQQIAFVDTETGELQERRLQHPEEAAKCVWESSPDVVQEALSLGAWGYVVKARAGTDLLAAVEAVLGGRQFVSFGLPAHNFA